MSGNNNVDPKALANLDDYVKKSGEGVFLGKRHTDWDGQPPEAKKQPGEKEKPAEAEEKPSSSS